MSQLLPESFWQLMAHQAFLLLCGLYARQISPRATSFYSSAFIPCQRMLSLARLRNPSVPMWDICISWNDQTVAFGDEVIVESEVISDSVIRGQGG